MVKKLIVVVVSLAIIACANQFPVKVRTHVHPGMSKPELIEALGNPNGFKTQDGKEILLYSDRHVADTGTNRTDFFFVFKDDKLIEAGHGEVRHNRSSGGVRTTTILVPGIY